MAKPRKNPVIKSLAALLFGAIAYRILRALGRWETEEDGRAEEIELPSARVSQERTSSGTAGSYTTSAGVGGTASKSPDPSPAPGTGQDATAGVDMAPVGAGGEQAPLEETGSSRGFDISGPEGTAPFAEAAAPDVETRSAPSGGEIPAEVSHSLEKQPSSAETMAAFTPAAPPEEAQAMAPEAQIAPTPSAQAIPDVDTGDEASGDEASGDEASGAEAAVAETSVAETAAEEARPLVRDDLEIIEGIGPKIAQVLRDAGISSFQQLAEASQERLSEILQGAGLRLANAESWPEQAALAAAGDDEGLAALQGQLKAGRRVE